MADNKSILKYSSMAFEMMAIMLVAIFGGRYLDEYFGNEQQYITLFLVIFGIIGYLIKVVKDTSKS